MLPVESTETLTLPLMRKRIQVLEHLRKLTMLTVIKVGPRSSYLTFEEQSKSFPYGEEATRYRRYLTGEGKTWCDRVPPAPTQPTTVKANDKWSSLVRCVQKNELAYWTHTPDL